MNEIVVCADVHEGINFGWLIDPETGISARAIDIHKNFARVAEFAIKEKSKLFVILGDLFDRTHISPTYRELIRKDVIEPLGNASINVWIIAGNHDQPHTPKKGTSIDDFRGYPHVKVYKEPTAEKVAVNGKETLFIILPYLHPERIVDIGKKKLEKEISSEEMFALGQQVLKNWLLEKSKLDADFKILLAHYYVEGAKLREVTYPEVLPGEFALKKEFIPPNLDLVVLGHVHLHQSLGRVGRAELVYTGAVERVDWGERDDEKGFLTINPLEKSFEFKRLPVRAMEKISVVIKPNEEPTNKILENIQDIKDKLIRLEVALPGGMRARIKESELAEKLKESFHYEIKWIEQAEEKGEIISFTANPFELLKNFIEISYYEHPRKNELVNLGNEILKEVLE
ncbi:MAG: DNA repair exonuclease [Candidatus Thermoplasmatota archaeon]